MANWKMTFKTPEKAKIVEFHQWGIDGYTLVNSKVAYQDAQKRAKKLQWEVFEVKEVY